MGSQFTHHGSDGGALIDLWRQHGNNTRDMVSVSLHDLPKRNDLLERMPETMRERLLHDAEVMP